MIRRFLFLLGIFAFCNGFAQDSVLTSIIRQNNSLFAPSGNSFSGEGWRKIDSAIKSSKNVLIGEDHFLGEVPLFVDAIAQRVKFDNFVIEIDPYSAALLQNKINTLSTGQFNEYEKTFGNTFSFYALEKEMDLLQKMVKNKTTIMGTDQVLMIADRLLCSELKKITTNPAAKKLYDKIETESKSHFDNFLKDPSKPMYMLTQDFEETLNKLLAMKLSAQETAQIKDIQLSRRIYIGQNHFLRLQLMKNNFYRLYYRQLEGKRNLFKFGASHMCKGEGLLGGYDIGNIVYNIADSKFEKSLHILVVGKNGMKGTPFRGWSPQALDPDNGDLKALQPFFKEVKSKEWHCFDLTPVHKAISEGKLVINDIYLRRFVQGFDLLVVIPEVTAAGFKN